VTSFGESREHPCCAVGQTDVSAEELGSKRHVPQAAHRLLRSRNMANIRSARRGDVLRVTVRGRLSTGDMRRLEYACAPALTSLPAKLELDLRRVTHADATAAAVLERISQLGARITGSLHVTTETRPVSQRTRSHASEEKKA
jgi:hypothetical protein